MIPFLSTAFTVGVAVGAFSLLIAWAKSHASDLRVASEQFDVAYGAVQKLIKSGDTPMSVLHLAEFFLSRSGTPFLARRFAIHLITGGLTKPAGEEAQRFARDLGRLAAPERDAFRKMIVAGMISSAASDPLLSRIYLMAVQTFLSSSGRENDPPSEERTMTVAADFAVSAPCPELATA